MRCILTAYTERGKRGYTETSGCCTKSGCTGCAHSERTRSSNEWGSSSSSVGHAHEDAIGFTPRTHTHLNDLPTQDLERCTDLASDLSRALGMTRSAEIAKLLLAVSNGACVGRTRGSGHSTVVQSGDAHCHGDGPGHHDDTRSPGDGARSAGDDAPGSNVSHRGSNVSSPTLYLPGSCVRHLVRVALAGLSEELLLTAAAHLDVHEVLRQGGVQMQEGVVGDLGERQREYVRCVFLRETLRCVFTWGVLCMGGVAVCTW